MTNHIFMKAKYSKRGTSNFQNRKLASIVCIHFIYNIYTNHVCTFMATTQGEGGSYTLIGWTILVCICCERPECSSINLSSVNDKFKTCKIVHKKSGWIDNERWMPSCSNDMTNLNVFFPYDLIQCTCKMCQDIVVWNCLLKKNYCSVIMHKNNSWGYNKECYS